MKKILIFLLLSLTVFVAKAQTKEIDSLKTRLKNSKNDSLKIELCLDIGSEYYSYNNDSLYKYYKKGLVLSKKTNNYLLERAYNGKGLYFLNKSELDSAKYYFKKVIVVGEEKKDTLTQITGYSNYGATLRDDIDFKEQIEVELNVLRLSENDKELLSEAQYNLAVTYKNSGYDSLSVKYLKLATKNGRLSNHKLLLSFSLSALANYASNNNELTRAKKYLDECFELCKEAKSVRICNNYYSDLALYYTKTGEFTKAEQAYNKALSGVKELGEVYDIMHMYVSLGEYFVMVKEPRKAIINFQKFEKIHVNNTTPDLSIRAYKKWYEAERMLKNYKASNKFLEKYVNLKDSLNSKKNKIAIANAEAKYQTEKKGKELTEQKLALQKRNAQFTLMTGLAILFLVATVLTWFLYQQRQQRKNQEILTLKREQQVKTLESLMEGEEKERLRIAKELHDGVNVDLSAIKYKLTSLLEKNNIVINEAVAMIDKSCEQVRAISHNLVPPSLKDFNLLESIEDFCSTMNSIHEPSISFQYIGDSISLSKKVEVNIFRIVQELVNNAIKHAQATEIDVQINHRDKAFQLTVEDNGTGFKGEAIESDGIGLQNIQSRVEYIKGKLDFSTGIEGTSFIIDMNTNDLV